MIGDNDTVFRLTIAAELVAMGGVRDYYFFFRSKESISERLQGERRIPIKDATPARR